MPRNEVQTRKQHAGFSLITAVVVVLMVTIVGLSAMTVSRSQLQAAGNAQYQIAALHEADRGAATAETWLNDDNNSRNSGFKTRSSDKPGYYPAGHIKTNNLNPLTWSWADTNSIPLNNGASRYLIEEVARNVLPMGESQRGLVDPEGNTDCKNVDVFRVTARGTSAAGASRTVQSVYSVDACN